jgi:cell division protein FtsW
MPFPARLKTELQIDTILLTIVLTLLLGGFVILASASISISDNAAGNPFFYIQRQLVAATIGAVAGGVCLFIPMRVWQNLGPLMLFAGMALLIVVLVPGIGYEVNGSTRWVRIGIMNLQVSEPARLCFLMYLAGYLVRRNKSLREEFVGFLRPMLVLTF